MPASLRTKYEELLCMGASSVTLTPDLAERLHHGDQDAEILLFQQVHEWVMAQVPATLADFCKKLPGLPKWPRLASTPAQFSEELALDVKFIATCLKLLHNIPDHRPSKNADRDKKVYELKSRNSHLSYGEIATRLARDFQPHITPKHAERIYKRQMQRVVKNQRQRKLVLEYYEKTHTRSGQPLRPNTNEIPELYLNFVYEPPDE